jgi:hypothetical protein
MKERRFTKKDLERNEDPETIAGAVSGATGVSLMGGVGMAALGPVGAVVGALAGALGGWWVGREMQHAVDEMDRTEQEFRSLHARTERVRSYEEVRHAYQLGYLAGRNPRYDDSSFTEIDDELRAAWVQAHLKEPAAVSWDEIRPLAQDGFDLARGISES